jgi:1,2-dihydroxy-3-keto-5-methylthiopentene dioxygenase
MSRLTIYHQQQVQAEATEEAPIAATLAELGVTFRRWPLRESSGLTDAEILGLYQEDIEKVKQDFGFQSVDIVHLTPEHPKRLEFREKFLDEHTHSDFEVRFFVRGQGLFYFHPEIAEGALVYALLCTAGDFISVPAGVRHWFDMGSAPDFSAIRFFTTPEGWVAQFTGSRIAREHPLLP